MTQVAISGAHELVATLHREGIRGSIVRRLWHTDDLSAFRLALRLLPQLKEEWRERFSNALKQSSG